MNALGGGSLVPFKVSTGLKDLIGRDLITDDFVAVFELVKNSFDAHAKKVEIHFSEDAIVIKDDGKGMSRQDLIDKWLFVAYSAKRDGTEDADYRNRVGERGRPYAGAKGVGRFSCDRLGAELTLETRAKRQPRQSLRVDWRLYEVDPKQEFATVLLELSETALPPGAAWKALAATGTTLEIRELRAPWDRRKIQSLKRELTKLIDPFAERQSTFQIEVRATGEEEADAVDAAFNATRTESQEARLVVNGPVENPILEVVGRRTTSIRVAISDDGSTIETALEDRGELIYRIQEANKYGLLVGSGASADVYFLNRSAKATFAHRMGLPAVQFGSLFLFRNGFRVFPIGAEDDDFFGLNQRKQQGQRRFLGGRDLIGRIEVRGVDGFDEATSRNQGLIETPEVVQLREFVRDKCVKRLERYVVDITWKDSFDKDVGDLSRMRLDESSALIGQLVSRLAASEGVTLLEYSPDLVRIVDEKSQQFETSLKALELLADETGDPALVARVDEARARIKDLQAAEAEAREAERRAEARMAVAEMAVVAAEARYGDERERNSFLVAATSFDQDTILNLHHQIMLHASEVHHDVKRMMNKIRAGALLDDGAWIDFLERVSFRNSQILTAARFATKGGYKHQAVEVEADLSTYICDYIEKVSSLWAPQGKTIAASSDMKPFKRKFKPIEIGIVIDNLVSNAFKKPALATRIQFNLRTVRGAKDDLVIDVADDGNGWPPKVKPVERVFEKGVTSSEGSGLGLFHVRQVVEGMRGLINTVEGAYSEDLPGAHLMIRFPP